MAIGQVVVIALAGLLGWLWFPRGKAQSVETLHVPVTQRTGVIALCLFVALLVGLPLLRLTTDSGGGGVALFDSFYRVGSLVFGGGHVVLPLLQAEVVPQGWVTSAEFIAGYAAAQAIPGPLFTFSAYLGAVRGSWPNGVMGAVVALVAIFLPSFMLVVGTLPFWETLRRHPGFQSALGGINAAVVGDTSCGALQSRVDERRREACGLRSGARMRRLTDGLEIAAVGRRNLCCGGRMDHERFLLTDSGASYGVQRRIGSRVDLNGAGASDMAGPS